jgi:hypothetical protein
MKANSHLNTNILKTLIVTFIFLFTSTNGLAELKQVEKVYAQKGYPYEGLVNRSDEVTIFYTKNVDTINCRVEVSQNGETWRGEEHDANVKTFTQKPLRACLNRVDAKKLLANTF